MSVKMRSKAIYIMALCLIIALTGCTNLFFQPGKRHVIHPSQFGIEYQDVYFKSVDNLDLHGWWFPSPEKSKALLVYLHGNGENISTHSAAVHWLTKHKYDVFIFDYRGYGWSQGIPDMDKAMTDIYQALVYANKRKIAGNKLFVMGQSLGASMGIYALTQKPEGIDGVIFVSPFSDYRKIARHALASSWLTWAFQWPLSLTVSNEYRPLDYVNQLPEIPVLYLYSQEDQVIPEEQVKELFEESNKPKFIDKVEGTHSRIFGIESNRNIILNYLNEWLE